MPEPGPIILLTRPRAASERFADALRARFSGSAEIVIAPVIEIEPVGSLVDPRAWRTVVFTSVHGVERAPEGHGVTAYCVGDTTAHRAAEAGYRVISADGTADDLVVRLLDDAPEGPILHIRGAHGTSLVDRLGAEASERVTYRQVDREIPADVLERLALAHRVIAPVFSPRSAQRLRACAGGLDGMNVIAISQAAAEEWGGPATVAEAPTRRAMEEAIAQAVDSDSPYPG